MLRDPHRESPLEAILQGARADTAHAGAVYLWPDGDVALLPCIGIPGNEAAMSRPRPDTATENRVRWFAADGDIAALAATWLDVVLPGDGALEIHAWQAHRPVVLL